MFCWKCGKELPENAKFCPGCGTQIVKRECENEEKTIQPDNVSLTAPDSSALLERMSLLKDFKGVFWGTIICLLASIMVMGGEIFEVTYQMFGEYSERVTMFDGREALKVVLVLANLIVIVLMLAPLVMGKNYERYNLVPAVIIPIANMLILLIVMMSAKEQMNESMLMEAVRAKAALTGNGWVYLITNIAALFLSLNAKNIVSEPVNTDITKTTEKDNTNRPYRCAFCDMEGPYEGECPRCGSVSKKYE